MNKKNYEKVKLGRKKLNGKICVDTKKNLIGKKKKLDDELNLGQN